MSENSVVTQPCGNNAAWNEMQRQAGEGEIHQLLAQDGVAAVGRSVFLTPIHVGSHETCEVGESNQTLFGSKGEVLGWLVRYITLTNPRSYFFRMIEPTIP